MLFMLSVEQKARLRWHCRRGMLELDLLLVDFLDVYVDVFTDEQFCAFETLLEASDPSIYSWLIGYETPPDAALRSIVDEIAAYHNTK